MTPLNALITALIRLLGLFFVVRALDSAAAPMFYLLQVSVLPSGQGFQISNAWAIFLPMVGFYLALAVAIFFAAPRLARLMIGQDHGVEEQVPWHETLIFCTGFVIVSWAFVRFTDMLYRSIGEATSNSGRYSFDNATMAYLFLTVVLLRGGLHLIAKFHRISQEWRGDERQRTGQWSQALTRGAHAACRLVGRWRRGAACTSCGGAPRPVWPAWA